MSLKIVIPMAGRGQRFGASTLEMPKPLLQVFPGKYMIDFVLQYLRPGEPHEFIFVCLEKHARKFDLSKFFSDRVKRFKIVTTKRVTKGPACTALLAKAHINDHQPILIVYCDDYLNINLPAKLKYWRNKKADGGLLVFPHASKSMSYAACDANGRVFRTAEKEIISRWATAGLYYFREGRFFVRSAKQLMRKKLRSKGEYFVSTVYNHLIADNMKVIAHKIPTAAYQSMGTPETMRKFIRNKKRVGN